MWKYNGESIGTALPPTVRDGDYNRPREFFWNRGTEDWKYAVLATFGYTWEEPAPPTLEQVQLSVRAQRNSLLLSCDWTQIADSPLTPQQKTDWATYRQSLREIPEQAIFETDPASVVWPEPPASGLDYYFQE